VGQLDLTVRADRNPVLFSCCVGETAETVLLADAGLATMEGAINANPIRL
jgi:hypothetical protein